MNVTIKLVYEDFHRVSAMDKVLFFPIEDVNFNDLFDWSTQTLAPACVPATTKIGTVRKQLNRQNSEAGNLGCVNLQQVALFRVGSIVYATDENCPHAGGPLHLGDIESLPDMSLCVRCPWHSWRYNLKSGKLEAPKGRNLHLKVYPTKVDFDGKIWVGFEQFDPSVFKDFMD